MSAKVPGWAFFVLSTVLFASLVVGLWSDATKGGVFEAPYLVNLLSSLAGFSASGLFLGLVVNRYQRSRYRGVELDRRVASMKELRDLLERLRVLLPENHRGRSPALSGTEMTSDPQRIAAGLLAGTHAALVDFQTVPSEELALVQPVLPSMWSIVEYVGIGERLERRLSFIADGTLLYSTDRLDVKLRTLAADVERWQEGRSLSVYSILLIDLASVLSASVGVIDWLVTAPNKKMRSNVLEGVRNSAK